MHVSTDYVFDGEASRPYDEWDAVRPISEYGRSKLGGELEVERHAALVGDRPHRPGSSAAGGPTS